MRRTPFYDHTFRKRDGSTNKSAVTVSTMAFFFVCAYFSHTNMIIKLAQSEERTQARRTFFFCGGK